MATDVETTEEVGDEFMNGSLDDDTVDTTDLTEEEIPDPVTDETTEEVTDGPARDEQGRFAKKEEAEGVEEKPAADTSEAPAPEAAIVETVSEVAPVPFTVRVNKQDFTLDGAEYIPGKGLNVKDEQVELVRGLIQEGAYYKQNWRTLEQQAIQKGRTEALATAPEIQQAKALTAQIDALLQDPEKLAEFFANYEVNAPLLKERAQREIAERQLQEFQNRNKEVEDTASRERIEQEKHATLSETMTELKGVADLKVLTDEDWRTIDRQVARLNQTGALFVEKEDGTYLNVPLIEEIAKDILAYRKQVVETAKKAEEAAKFNAMNKPKGKTPPAANTAPRKGTPPKKETSAELDHRAIRRAFMRGDMDDDE